MNKDEMIKDMAKVLCDKDKRCEECISRLLLPCGYKSYCTRLYNAGYRKVGKNKTVVNKSEIGLLNKTISFLEMEKDQLNKQLEQERKSCRLIADDEIVIKTSETECCDEKVIAFFEEHNAKVRKQTAREILQEMLKYEDELPLLSREEIYEEIAKKYGIELERNYENHY